MLYHSKKLVIENSREFQISYGAFTFKKDFLTIIKGTSGIGKTTLLKVLALLSWNVSQESEITLYIDGKSKPLELKDLDWRKAQQLREVHFSYILQDDHLIDAISVKENILFPSLLLHEEISSTKKKLEELLEKPFLSPIAKRLGDSCSVLSGGEKKKAALLRAILKDPEILIADEPWTNLGGNLNEGDVNDYVDFFIEQRTNKSTLLATHHEGVIEKYKDCDFVKAFEMIEVEEKGTLRKLELKEID
jgi:ABC-type lipoprotein export system ATPase subunit